MRPLFVNNHRHEVVALLFFASFCAIAHAAVGGLKGDATASKRPVRLASFPLIPGDSPEARRRRRERRRRLAPETLEWHTTNSTTTIREEEEEEDESPLELQKGALMLGYGVHYVDLWVGCPQPQRVTVIVDTGSSVTGFPCLGCHHCGGDADSSDEQLQYHTDELFRQDDSKCFEKVQSKDSCIVGYWNSGSQSCRASKHYSEGSSWDAFEAVDMVYTGGDHNEADLSLEGKESFQLHFGCQYSVTGLFETQLADGIMGLYNSPASFWAQMHSQGKIEQRAFSLCFSEPGHVERTGTPAGAMVMGGTDTRLHTTPMVYAEQMSNDGKYVLHLEKVYLMEPKNGEARPVKDRTHNVQIFEEDLNNRGPVILDSGTTATYLTKQLERHFIDVFNSLVPEDVMVLGSKDGYMLTQRQLEQLPSIVFQMKGWKSDEEEDDEYNTPTSTFVPGVVGPDLDSRHAGKSIVVAMSPYNYMSRSDDYEDELLTNPDQVNHYKFNVYFTKSKGKGGVLGGNFMKGHDILFDIDNSRIGFAESDCEYAVLANDEESG